MTREQWRLQYKLWKERRNERPENIGIAPLVTFEPLGVKFHLPFDTPPGLSYKVRLAKNEWIELSTGFTIVDKKSSAVGLDEEKARREREEFRPLEGGLWVSEENDESNEADRNGIGRITYWPADGDLSFVDSYSVEVLVPKVTFNELLAATRVGRIPSHIGIKVEGMDFGSAPDGSMKKWDNKAFPELDVTSVDFTFSERPTVFDEASPPTRSQVNELSEKLDRLESGLRTLLWAVLGIGVLMLILSILR